MKILENFRYNIFYNEFSYQKIVKQYYKKIVYLTLFVDDLTI